MTYRNRSGCSLGLLAVMLLAFGLAGCGGDEPAAAVPPPAPPPAPPPFEPQAVEVALGTSGDTLTLMTTEAGGFTLNGEAFATGTEVTSQKNGSTYALTLDGTTWKAAYKVPEAMSLALGATGGNLSIERLEDGSFQANGSALASGTVVTADNGNQYTVSISDDGMFSAEYVAPPALSIPLGTSGTSVDVTKNEDGTFSANGGVITAATRVTADNGNVYRAILVDGIPVGAAHVAATVEVPLGTLGGTLGLTQSEDKSWTITGTDTAVVGGYVHTAANGNMYELTMDAEGMWSATYKALEATVGTGTSGSVTLSRAEDGSWWIGSEAFESGQEFEQANGNVYILTFADGAWSADFQPVSMAIEGTGLTAMTREGDDMYDVGEGTLDASGVGNVTVDGAMYRVWMADGGLAGARYDVALKDKTAAGPTDAGSRILTPADVALSTDDPDTAANEAATMLVIAGEEYPVGTLLGGGSASKTGATFVEKARAEVEKLAGQVKALADLNASLDRDDRSDFSTTIEAKWTLAQKAVDSIFGRDKITLPTLSRRGGIVDESRAVDDFEELQDALGSADMFEAALDDGILEDGGKDALDNKAAAAVFGAVKSESAALLGTTETTRYGVFASQGRKTATDDLKFTVAGADTDQHQGAIGAFAYGLVDDTVRTSHLPSSGTASYEGGTTAVSGGRDPELYSGLFSMEVNFPTKRVTALITNLQDEQGNAWQYQLRDAKSIYFPGVSLDGQAHFRSRSGYQASVTHVGFAAQPVSAGSTQFEGWLVGAGRDEAAGTGAFGTWSLGDRQNAGASYLVGSFGAERTGSRDAETPSVVGAVSESWITYGDTAGFFKDGGTVFRPLAGDPRPDDPDKVYEIDLATLEQDGEGGKTEINGTRTIDKLREDIEGWLAELKGYIAVDEADGSSSYSQNDKRDEVWTDIKSEINKVVFASRLESGGKVQVNSRHRPVYDAELLQRPLVSTDPTGTNFYNVPSEDDPSTNVEVELAKRVELMVLSYDDYPGLTGTSGTPNDDAAQQEIEAVLDALADGTTLEAALSAGGLWEGLLAETRTLYYDVNRDGYADVKNRKRLVADSKLGEAWDERSFTTHLRLGTTDFTRFGIAWGTRHEDGRDFAYSPLPQTRYENASSPGYPGGASATYKGSTLVRQFSGRGLREYEGAVEVEVSWDAVNIDASTMSVTFSELAKVSDGEPFSMDFLLIDYQGNMLLKNGNSLSRTNGAAGTAAGFIDYHAVETHDGGMYRGIEDTQQVSYGDGGNSNQVSTTPAIVDPVVNANRQMYWDRRNRQADYVRFAVDEIIFRTDITVTQDGELLGFGSAGSGHQDVDIVWADATFQNTTMEADKGDRIGGLGGRIEGEFVGQGAEGPLAAMGVWSFVAPLGVLQAATVGTAADDAKFNGSGGTPDVGDVFDGWMDGTAEFAPADNSGNIIAGARFNPNVRSPFVGNVPYVDFWQGTVVNSSTSNSRRLTADDVGYLLRSTVRGAFGTGAVGSANGIRSGRSQGRADSALPFPRAPSIFGSSSVKIPSTA